MAAFPRPPQSPWDSLLDPGRPSPPPQIPPPYVPPSNQAPDLVSNKDLSKIRFDGIEAGGLGERTIPNLDQFIRRDGTPPAGSQTWMPPFQFDDAYTNLLERLAQGQLNEVRSNPGLDSLMSFLRSQFQDLSTNPGYNRDELAMLNTQAFEPIEANRNASKQRARERAAAQGWDDSSGLHELDLRDIERAADQARTVAGRDLAIAGLDRRDRDLARALDLGQLMGLDIPRSQRGEEIALGSLLYQLPRTAMMDALSVINGTPSSSDAFGNIMQLLQSQYGQQNRRDANNSALFGQIGSMLAGLFG